jgi:phage repressor protein C with HTH and peptisase S24 domain
MQAARLLHRNPQIAIKLEAGVLNLSQLIKVEQSLKQEKKSGKAVSQEVTQNILAKLENKSGFETAKILACELDQPAKTSQKVKPQKDDSVRMEFTLRKEQYETLKKAQSLVSHSVPDNDFAEVITFLAESYIKKIEGKVKTPREEKGGAPKASTQKNLETPTQSFRENPLSTKQKTYNSVGEKRNYISVKIRREVFGKAEHSCEYVNPKTGERCLSRYQLDHIQPMALGGSNDVSNLRVLCGVCNRREALRWGLSRPYRNSLDRDGSSLRQ